MSLSRRDRYLWRIFLWVLLVSAVVSAGFGIRVAPEEEWWLRSAAHGAITSLLIATPILLLELKGGRMAVVRRLRRRPLVVFLACKALFYFVAIVGGLLVARQLLVHDVVDYIQVNPVFRKALVFSVAMAVVGTLFFEISGLIGMGTLKNLLLGRYVQPRREQRAFLLIDMKDSTGMAERLGPVKFHELLSDFFRDVSDAALECDAEIHKYVGDEAILTWKGGAPWPTATACAAPSSRAMSSSGIEMATSRAMAWCRPSAPPSTTARSSPARSATCGARSPMSATR